MAESLEFRPGRRLAHGGGMKAQSRFVYIIKNANNPPEYYTGLTSDIDARMHAHNQRNGHHTSGRGPWALDVLIEFADEARAVRMERYLKSGSGAAFARRHLR
jgi:predicted GIY-YIG superfamily endonuclease